MNHLQMSEQNTRGTNEVALRTNTTEKFPSSFPLNPFLPQCVADGGSCTPSSAPLLALLTCRLKPRTVFMDKTALVDNKPDQYHFCDIVLKSEEIASSWLSYLSINTHKTEKHSDGIKRNGSGNTTDLPCFPLNVTQKTISKIVSYYVYRCIVSKRQG